VLVSLHGGGFATGSGGAPGFNGHPLAKYGDVVVVTINHRLGCLGYLHLADLGAPAEFAQSGVVGMLDCVAALEWVRDNIESFGGNPANVMVFGQSGGGAKTGTLLSMPAAKGLFHRAAIQSGPTLRLTTRENATRSAGAIPGADGSDEEPDPRIAGCAVLNDGSRPGCAGCASTACGLRARSGRYRNSAPPV
jgi:para-nitrobenzyl esterase